ncbi:hypothetical protein FHL15_007141 [Xylaria flabelliformis]|uniref:Uncharacterized protein n=1 Tax=Xylaria flabelliformis TaxID=2512241 RepID=A0A553HVR7_9PEZI|nr:hypothetical protein FHL15_007141 [Xylaria flabelliformis]
MALARDEIQHSARHSADKIMHKISNRSLQSKCSHESSDDELLEVQKGNAPSTSSPATPSASPSPAILERHYAQSQRAPTPDRGKATDRNLLGGDISPGGRGSNGERRRSPSPNYRPLSQDSVSPETQPMRPSIDDLAIPMHSSHKNIAATRDLSSHIEEGGEHKAADGDLVDVDRAESVCTHEGKPTDLDFEDVNLGDSKQKVSS